MSANTLQVGDSFGDYRTVKLLGRGGMGEVWLLESAGAGVRVAAKILDPSCAASHESRKRFVREATLAMAVKHPNIVDVYDVGEDPDTGLAYIMMEYMPGGTLSGRIKSQGPFPVVEALSIARSLASALAVAGRKGIVHRDIKPSNIMFAADGTPKLSDLGIARVERQSAEEPDADNATVTQTGAILGTPAYMSPEQMLDAHAADSRADIYSLGVVLFEMLTGERPYKDATVFQLMAKAVSGEQMPSVRSRRADVPEGVSQLVAMMCEHDVGKRIQDAGKVVDLCESLIEACKRKTQRRKTAVTRPVMHRPAQDALPPVWLMTLAAFSVFVVFLLLFLRNGGR